MESCFCIYQRMSDTHCKCTEYRTQAYPLGIHHQKIQICKRQQLLRVFRNVRNNRDTKVSAKRLLWQKVRKPRIHSFSAITNFKLLKEIVITSQVVEDE